MIALPPEFELVAACCIWPPSAQKVQAIYDACAHSLDWERFLRIVKRQRVVGFVWNTLSHARIGIPADAANALRAMAASIPLENLKFAAESARIQRALDKAGVPVVFVKGVTLGQLAYGGIGTKYSWDVDVLVTPEAVPQALTVLGGMGYRAFPRLSPEREKEFARWLRFAREAVLFHETNSVPVELHWRLTSNPYFLNGVSAASPTQTVTVAGELELRTLTGDDLLAYLCLHGAFHGWSRLKWLVDVAALMAKDSAADAQRRLNAAKALKAEHAVAQAFLLCDRLFGTPHLAELSRALRGHVRYRCLEHVALKAMLQETELGKPRFGTLFTLLSHFLLGDGVKYYTSEMWIKLNSPHEMPNLLLPRGLPFLYPAIRLTRWVGRMGRSGPPIAPPKNKPG